MAIGPGWWLAKKNRHIFLACNICILRDGYAMDTRWRCVLDASSMRPRSFQSQPITVHIKLHKNRETKTPNQQQQHLKYGF